MQGLTEFLKTIGVPRLIAMGAVTAGLIAFFAFIMVRVTSPTMTLLFADLSQEDSASIVKDLERQGLSFEIRNDGADGYVIADAVQWLAIR